MKIEIGESLCLSYLKHVKKCVLYQTNWKSSSQWEKFNEETVEAIFHKITEHETFKNIFKQNDLHQLLKQAEIDALGMDQGRKIYAVDIAFHGNGLNYGGTEETTERIVKKCIRSYLMLLSYFPDREYEIIFAAPKVHPATEESIRKVFDELESIFPDGNVEFKYFSNESFSNEFLATTIGESKEDSDTGELFMRAYSLLQFALPSEQLTAVEQNPIMRKGRTTKESLELEFIPSDENAFKQQLIRFKRAKRTWFYADGRKVEDEWDASNFKPESNLRGNIYSNNKVRMREETGLEKIRFEIIDA